MDEQLPSTSRTPAMGSRTRSGIAAPADESNDGNDSEAEKFPLILTKKYFTVVSVSTTTSTATSNENEQDNNIQAMCASCKTTIKGSMKATSNFRTHLKRKHPDILNEYDEDKAKLHIPGKRKKTLVTGTTGDTSLKQSKISFTLQKEATVQKKLDENIVNYIVQSMKPLNTVDDPNFVKIFTDLPDNLKVMSRRTLGRKIEMTQKGITENLKSTLSHVDYVSTTADIWSTKTRSFLGVTIHWIDKDKLERKSGVLSFERFRGSHTFDKIAEMLFNIQDQFDLKHDQVVSTTTDNGSNFVKAFREFGITQYVPDFEVTEDVNVEDAEITSNTATDSDNLLFEEVLLPDNSVEEVVTRELHLPRHLRCASHTLSLLATTDFNNFIKNSPISRIHYSAIAKCTLLWNMSRKPKSAEIIKECLGHQLIYPCPTRWNSLYDSIVRLIKTKAQLNDLFHKLGKNNTFSAIELEYLEEFIDVMKPVATALDYVQGNNGYYGMLLPTLMSLRTRLQRLLLRQGNNLSHFSVVVSKMIESLERRFESFFMLSPEVNEAILASCYHPAYKMKWLPETISDEERQRIQKLAVYALEANYKKHEERNTNMTGRSSRSSTTSKDDEVEEFIVFESSTNSSRPQASHLELELVRFLNDKNKDVISLNSYPNIKDVFTKFNTSLCSSGPVERLFSHAGFIHSPTKGSLSDGMFKTLVFFKGNSCVN